jgi:hypothetical protein
MYFFGDSRPTAQLLEEGLITFRAQGDREGIGCILGALGYVEIALGDLGGATLCFGESLAVFRDLGDKRGIAWCVAGLAAVAVATEPRLEQDTDGRAARLLGAAEAIHGSLDIPWLWLYRRDFDQTVATIRARQPETAFTAAWAEGKTMTLEQAIAYAIT